MCTADPGEQFATCKFTLQLAVQVAPGFCLLTSLLYHKNKPTLYPIQENKVASCLPLIDWYNSWLVGLVSVFSQGLLALAFTSSVAVAKKEMYAVAQVTILQSVWLWEGIESSQ